MSQFTTIFSIPRDKLKAFADVLLSNDEDALEDAWDATAHIHLDDFLSIHWLALMQQFGLEGNSHDEPDGFQASCDDEDGGARMLFEVAHTLVARLRGMDPDEILACARSLAPRPEFAGWPWQERADDIGALTSEAAAFFRSQPPDHAFVEYATY